MTEHHHEWWIPKVAPEGEHPDVLGSEIEQGGREDVVRMDPAPGNDGHLLLDRDNASDIGKIGEGAEVHEPGFPLVCVQGIDEVLVNVRDIGEVLEDSPVDLESGEHAAVHPYV
jgi:hypothetical protein